LQAEPNFTEISGLGFSVLQNYKNSGEQQTAVIIRELWPVFPATTEIQFSQPDPDSVLKGLAILVGLNKIHPDLLEDIIEPGKDFIVIFVIIQPDPICPGDQVKIEVADQRQLIGQEPFEVIFDMCFGIKLVLIAEQVLRQKLEAPQVLRDKPGDGSVEMLVVGQFHRTVIQKATHPAR